MMPVMLSIIIPAYNAEKYIAECLKTLKLLTLSDVEILVINDGSTDSTAVIVNDFVFLDSRIRLISVKNGGVSRARNIGLAEASGQYIMFLDADDYLLTGAYDELVNLLKTNMYDFAAFARDIIEADGMIWHGCFPFEGERTNDRKIADSIMFANSLFNECWGKIYKKSIIDKYNIVFPNDVPVGEDLMFVMEYYSHCKSFYVTNTSLVAYRQHGGSAMRRYNISQRMKYTENLFGFSRKFKPDIPKEDIAFYYFKVLTNLCREYSKGKIDVEVIKNIYNSDMTRAVINELNSVTVPLYRKHEYILMKKKMYLLSAIYFYIKGLRR